MTKRNNNVAEFIKNINKGLDEFKKAEKILVDEFSKLVQTIKEQTKPRPKIALLGHKNGDPDLFACFRALNEYFEKKGIQCDFFSDGPVSHPQTKVFMNRFEIETKPSKELKVLAPARDRAAKMNEKKASKIHIKAKNGFTGT